MSVRLWVCRVDARVDEKVRVEYIRVGDKLEYFCGVHFEGMGEDV